MQLNLFKTMKSLLLLNINEFNLHDLSQIYFDHGFDFHCIKDKATDSLCLEVGKKSGVMRQMYIIIGKQNLLNM